LTATLNIKHTVELAPQRKSDKFVAMVKSLTSSQIVMRFMRYHIVPMLGANSNSPKLQIVGSSDKNSSDNADAGRNNRLPFSG